MNAALPNTAATSAASRGSASTGFLAEAQKPADSPAKAENAPSSSEARTNRILVARVDQLFAALDWRPAFRDAAFDRICPSPNFFAKADLCAA